MKNLSVFLSISISILMLLFIQSCKKEKSNNENETNTLVEEPLTNALDTSQIGWIAAIDGSSFTADTSAIGHSYDADLDLHVFTGPDTGSKIITLFLRHLEPGTYDIDFDQTIVTYQYGTTLYSGGFNPQGTVTITKNENNTITGTFEADLFDFNTAGEVSVTSGIFNHLPFTP